LLKDDGQAVCLIKPQFEAGKDKVGKKGVVSDLNTHLEVVENVIQMALTNGFSVCGLEFSPVKGPEGNIEYLIYLAKSNNAVVMENVNPKELVNKSHEELL
jgi:23S rRNA (cytidine1920-2'-O)/16S rRNA (cytidine1409-2'-O)-methyltransferase